MKRLALVATTLAALAFSAHAGPADYAFGNTIRSEGADGIVDYYVDEDGTFSTGGGETGTWSVDGAKICLTIGDSTSCGDLHEGAKPGDSWTEDDGAGGTRAVTLIEGR